MKDKTADEALADGTQKAAFDVIIDALKGLPDESKIRVLASAAILLNLADDVIRRLRTRIV